MMPDPQSGVISPSSAAPPKISWRTRLLRIALALFTFEIGLFLANLFGHRLEFLFRLRQVGFEFLAQVLELLIVLEDPRHIDQGDSMW